MGLVHRRQGDVRLLGQGEEGGGGETLRRDIQQLVLPPAGPAQGVPVLLLGKGGVEEGGGYARLPQGGHLILHQGDQGGDDQGHPRQQQGGELVAHRLARPGGHDAQHVPPGQEGVHQGLLGVAEVPLQGLVFVHGIAAFRRDFPSQFSTICRGRQGG